LKRTLVRLIPFICMFILATGSVALSCATNPQSRGARSERVSVNAERGPDGSIHTIWSFLEIKSVIVADSADRSRKIELTSADWRYDPVTTELAILRDIPFKRYYTTVAGIPEKPNAFVLHDILKDADLMVIMDDRLAIEGYDFSLEPATKRLSFRKDIVLSDAAWLIQYSTPEGMSSLGEWKGTEGDRMAFLQAEHSRRTLDAWYDRQTEFWFLEKDASSGISSASDQKPTLVKRAATDGELRRMKSAPMPVLKYRTKEGNARLSRELGFDASMPERLGLQNDSAAFPVFWKFIGETARDGNLMRTLSIAYDIAQSPGSSESDNALLEIELSLPGSEEPKTEEREWPISEETVDLGLPVAKTTQWALTCRNPDEKPAIDELATWTWQDKSARFVVQGPPSDAVRYEEAIRRIIAFRRERLR